MKTRNCYQFTIFDLSGKTLGEAIIERSHQESCPYASGVVGPSFATSGPGPGWTRQFGVFDFAAEALHAESGAESYIDADDGREATRNEGAEEGDELYSWSGESVIELVCPDVDEAIQDPNAFRAMVEALPKHEAASDMAAWRELRQTISDLAAIAEEIPEY